MSEENERVANETIDQMNTTFIKFIEDEKAAEQKKLDEEEAKVKEAKE